MVIEVVAVVVVVVGLGRGLHSGAAERCGRDICRLGCPPSF